MNEIEKKNELKTLKGILRVFNRLMKEQEQRERTLVESRKKQQEKRSLKLIVTNEIKLKPNNQNELFN